MMRQHQVDRQPSSYPTDASATQNRTDVSDIAQEQKIDEQIKEVYQAVKDQSTISD